MATQATLDLPHGGPIPRLGLGVYQMQPGKETQAAVESALALGYRHIDTAAIYRNEADVGAAIAASGVPRDEIFVTTKLAPGEHGFEETLNACDDSLVALGLDYVDLYLIHWPGSARRGASWRAFERLYEDGHCHAIGVSNYTERHLIELLDRCRVRPAANQIEMHPFVDQRTTRAICRAATICVEAYSPLTRGHRLDHPTVADVAREVDKTPAQVLIRWGLQQGAAVLVTARSEAHQRENLATLDFALSDEQVDRLSALADGFRCAWDPTMVP